MDIHRTRRHAAFARPATFFTLVAVALALVAGSPATAGAIVDATGDFLPTYAGPRRADLDIAIASVTAVNPTTLRFAVQLAGDVDPASGVHYVWVLNAGTGTEGLLAKTPPIGAGIAYDLSYDLFAYRVQRPFDPFNFQVSIGINQPGAPSIVALLLGTLSGSTLSFDATTSDLLLGPIVPATLRWNLWTATANVRGSNIAIADFAADGRMLAVNAAPAPPVWALLLLGALAGSLRPRGKTEHVDDGAAYRA